VQQRFFYKKCRLSGGILCTYYSSVFSHCWLAIPQLVLQADWQDVWHSPQPPFFALSQRLRVSIVLICVMITTSIKIFCRKYYHTIPIKVNDLHIYCAQSFYIFTIKSSLSVYAAVSEKSS